MAGFYTPERAARTTLGLLIRELALPATIWRDPVGRIVNAKNDTVNVHLPAYAPARTRALRSGATRTKDTLNERVLPIQLAIDIYKDVGITDEQRDLDITDFGAQVMAPITRGIVDQIGTEVAAVMTGSTYARSIAVTLASDDAWDDLILPAREYLNKAHVPQSGRFLAVGSEIETFLLANPEFIKANESGDGGTAMAEATLGRKGGFTIVSAPELPPDQGYAYHRTAYAMTSQAPAVPGGAARGSMVREAGFAMRVVEGFDLDSVENRVIFDSWLGVEDVTDEGYFDANGLWVPASEELGSEKTLSTSAAADDILDCTAHGFVAGDAVVFTELTGGAGLTVGQVYYVIAANLAANTFQVSTAVGGSAVNFTTDITAGKVRSGGDVHLVRGVKITGS